jgi:hypothetical protein
MSLHVQWLINYETKSYEKGFHTSVVCVGLFPETGAVLFTATSKKNTLLKRLIYEVFRVPNLRLLKDWVWNTTRLSAEF